MVRRLPHDATAFLQPHSRILYKFARINLDRVSQLSRLFAAIGLIDIPNIQYTGN